MLSWHILRKKPKNLSLSLLSIITNAKRSDSYPPKGKGRLTQDLNTKNIKSFSKSYQAAEKVIASALMVRYISTTLTISERLNTFANKLEKSKMKVVRQQPIITDCRQLLNEYRFGLIFISDENEFEKSGTLRLAFCLPAPALCHVLLDTICAWGFYGDWENADRNH